ncbi:glycosyltransferase family 4 protein [Halomicrococcus sp. NG-SE-24]|uniref:glycosyltransferase family 4 protein n=1 Tax=Halomicrococcus sp. NG-SE-24 TaxID=3436928 RepID=UPI003D97DCCA
MDIAYLSPYVYPFSKGGAEKRIHEIGSRLSNRGHDVTVYTRKSWEGAEIQEHAGITLQSIGPDRDLYTDKDGRRSVTAALKFAIRAAIPIIRYGEEHDILVTPVAPYFHVLTSQLAGSLQETPLVVTWHEVWDDYWYDYMGRTGSIGKLVEGVVGNVPHSPVAPSKMTARKFHELPGTDQKVTVIPNGIDTTRIEDIEPKSEGFDLLYAGRLIKDKNIDLLMEAFNRLDNDVTLGIIGDGPQRRALHKKAENLDCRDQITFLGFLEEYNDVLAHMQAADIFASPSVREGFGITFLEAMMADCTVITVDHPNSAGSEVVKNAGFVTAPTVNAIANAIDRAIKGEEPPTDPISRAKKFDWDRIAIETEEYFQTIAKNDN